MTDLGFNSTPQFGTAEYGTSSENQRCQLCRQPLATQYFRVNDARVCPGCVERIRRKRSQDSRPAFLRAITAGIGAAALGLVGYAFLTIVLQGWVISYMSFAVGWLVGMAMMKASGGVGGRRYQIAAVLLTYAAVSMSAIPVWIYFANEHRTEQTEQQKLQAEQRRLEEESGTRPSTSQPVKPRPSLGAWLARVTVLGLASPFLELEGNALWGVLGLVILFVGMRMAWRMTAGRPFEVLGPFENSPPAIS